MKIPYRLIKGNCTYKLIKVYKDFVLYENESTKVKECFSFFSLGLIKEQIKPTREALRGGAIKI